MMTPEAEHVARLVERTKAHVDDLLARYTERYNLAYESDTATQGEKEIAKTSLVPLWNEIHRRTFADEIYGRD